MGGLKEFEEWWAKNEWAHQCMSEIEWWGVNVKTSKDYAWEIWQAARRSK